VGAGLLGEDLARDGELDRWDYAAAPDGRGYVLTHR
jgi:hypothetical protein